MGFLVIIKNGISWIFNAKNRSLVLFILIGVLIALFCIEKSKISSLNNKISSQQEEAARQERNYKVGLDTIVQSYDKKTGTLTATISGYELTTAEYKKQYNDLFSAMGELKSKPPLTIIEKQMGIDDKFNTNVYSTIDSNGIGMITVKADTVFDSLNKRSLSGNIPYKVKIDTFNKFSILTGNSSFDIDQTMTVFTGINRDEKTKQISVWAKTNYPGVTFNLLRGATIEDDQATKKALESSRREWGLGFSGGYGFQYNSNQVRPGFFIGVGINYSPKKLQFAK